MMKQARPLRRVVIKEEYVALTGDHISAVLLSQIEYWTMRSRDFDKFMAEEKSRASKDGKDLNINLTHGWIYKTAQELSEETMMNMSNNSIRTRLKKLVEGGWIGERTNPLHKWDQTKQYRFNAAKVADDLEAIGYHLEGWFFENKSEKQSSDIKKRLNGAIANFANGISNSDIPFAIAEDRTFDNCDAIPEITTEINTGIKDQQQQPEIDLSNTADRDSHEKAVVDVVVSKPSDSKSNKQCEKIDEPSIAVSVSEVDRTVCPAAGPDEPNEYEAVGKIRDYALLQGIKDLSFKLALDVLNSDKVSFNIKRAENVINYAAQLNKKGELISLTGLVRHIITDPKFDLDSYVAPVVKPKGVSQKEDKYADFYINRRKT